MADDDDDKNKIINTEEILAAKKELKDLEAVIAKLHESAEDRNRERIV